jgi:hypothetical protein
LLWLQIRFALVYPDNSYPAQETDREKCTCMKIKLDLEYAVKMCGQRTQHGHSKRSPLCSMVRLQRGIVPSAPTPDRVVHDGRDGKSESSSQLRRRRVRKCNAPRRRSKFVPGSMSEIFHLRDSARAATKPSRRIVFQPRTQNPPQRQRRSGRGTRTPSTAQMVQ